MNRTARNHVDGATLTVTQIETLLEGFIERVRDQSVGLIAGSADVDGEYWIAGLEWGKNDATRILAYVYIATDRIYNAVNAMLAEIAKSMGVSYMNMR